MNRIFTLFFVVLSMCAQASQDDRTFLDADFKPITNESSAKYYRTAVLEAPLYLAQVYFLTDDIQMKGHYLDSNLTILHGECSYFYINGRIESQGVFENGKKIGTWKRFNENGVSKNDHYYASDIEIEARTDYKNAFPNFETHSQTWENFLTENLEFPTAAESNGVYKGEVHVCLDINTTGELTYFEVLFSSSNLFTAETIKLMDKMPNWNPALYRGKPVESKYILSIPFDNNTSRVDPTNDISLR